jgi:hypothetical protein
MSKCLQTKNYFGHPLSMFIGTCLVEDHHYSPECGTGAVGREACLHHEELTDEFLAFVLEVCDGMVHTDT